MPQLLSRADVLAGMHRFVSEVGDAVQLGTAGDADVRLGAGGADAVGPDNGIVRPVSTSFASERCCIDKATAHKYGCATNRQRGCY